MKIKVTKPRCFIAMAFDQEDTDDLYDNIILPILKRNGIIPVIINRRNDNNDINIQIIEQLNNCDFCIADLTYTRPSVYFEAGYAQRQVDVIYTVRSDHLKKDQPEYLRVHFDLQMKPLIIWHNTHNSNFGKKLETRLKTTVLRKFKIENDKKLSILKKEQNFKSFSIKTRLFFIRRRVLNYFYKKGIRNWFSIPQDLLSKKHSDKLFLLRRIIEKCTNPLNLLDNEGFYIGFYKPQKECLNVITLNVLDNLTINILKDEIGFSMLNEKKLYFENFLSNEEILEIKETNEYNIVISLKNISSDKIMSSIHSLEFDIDNNYYHTKIQFVGSPSINKHLILRNIFFYFISPITHIDQIKDKIEPIISAI